MSDHGKNPAPDRMRGSSCLRAGVAAAIASTLIAGPLSADDTEVFFGQAIKDSDAYPNVLFILDTSGSMTAKDGTSMSRMQRLQQAMHEIIDNSSNVNIGLMSLNGALEGGPVRYPVTPIDKELCTEGNCGAQMVYTQIKDVRDDTEEDIDDGKQRANGNWLTIGRSDTDEQRIGLRFRDLALPQGANILSARLEMSASYDNDNPMYIRYRGEKTSDSLPFTNADGDLAARAENLTDNWVNQAMGPWKQNLRYESEDLAPIVQELVDDPDWCGGQAMTFLARRVDQGEGAVPDDDRNRGGGGRSPQSLENALRGGSDNDTNTGEQLRQAVGLRVVYDTDSLADGEGCMTRTAVAQVSGSNDDVEQSMANDSVYREGTQLEIPRIVDGNASGHRDQTIGLRFRNLELPASADIVEAFIEFEVKAPGSGNPKVLIQGDAATDMPAYSGGSRGVTKRKTTSASVSWRDIPNPPVGAKVRTADVSPIVREIIAQPGWKSGQSIGMHLSRDGGPEANRKFKTWNGESAAAAKLFVRYEIDLGDVSTDTVAPVTAREELKKVIDELDTYGGTPLPGVHYEAAQYLLGGPVDFGSRRGRYYVWNSQQTHDQQERYHLSHPGSYSGGRIDYPTGCTSANPRSSACRAQAIVADAGGNGPTYDSPMATSCLASHVVLLSDGEATRGSPEDKIRKLTGVDACTSGNGNKSYTDPEQCGVDLAAWLYGRDHNDVVAGEQNIITHTIAFNLNQDKRYYLEDVAEAGGGGAYTAESAGDLVAVFDSILKSVLSIDTGFTAPGATVNQFNRLTHREDIYFALFRPESGPNWQGNLKRYRVGKTPDGSGEVDIRGADDEVAVDPLTGFFSERAHSFWDEYDMDGRLVTSPDGSKVSRGGAAARIEVAGPRARRMYTWLGDGSSIPSAGVDLTAEAQKFHETNAAITAELLGVQDVPGSTSEKAAYRRNLVRWARGVDVRDDDNDDDVNETRRKMGDPMHSRPVIVNYETARPATAQGAPEETEAAREARSNSLVFVATNEGVLHAIDAKTGDEKWAFTPKELLDNFKVFYEDDAAAPRPYGLDGSLSVWRNDPEQDFVVTEGTEDSAYLYIGMRRGGQGYYALDITDPDEPRLAWTVNGESGDFAELGETWSRATPARIRINGIAKNVVVFAGGYDTNQDPDPEASAPTHTVDGTARAIYIVDAKRGTLLHTLSSPLAAAPSTGGHQSFSKMTYGIPGDVRIVDADLDGFSDQLYAADTGGQVWRFDVNPYHGAGSDPLFSGDVIADLAGSRPNDHRRFYTEPDVALIERGGERFMSVSIGSGWRAHPLDRTVEDRIYLIKSPATRGNAITYGKQGTTGQAEPIVEDDLVKVNEHDFPPSNGYGWMLELEEPGEKVLGRSVTFDNQVVFSSYLPDGQADACSTALGSGRVYILDALTGAPTRDLDQDGTVEGNGGSTNDSNVGDDLYFELKHGGIPPEPAILISESGEPILVVGPEKIPTKLDNRTRRTFWADTGPVEASASSTSDEADAGEGDSVTSVDSDL